MLPKGFAAFKKRDFTLLWVSDFISTIGNRLLVVALAWQMYLLTHSAFALGLIGLVQLAPLLLFNIMGGLVADVHNRKIILYITNTTLIVTSLVLGITTFIHVITPVVIYIILAIAATASCFQEPARIALQTSVIDKKNMATFLIYEDLAEVGGPAIAGFLIAVIGVGNIYFLDAFSTLFAIGALYLLSVSGTPIGEKSEISLSAAKQGFQFLISKHILLSSMMLDAISVLFASCVVLMPIFAKDILHVGSQGLGFLYAAPAVGAVIMGIILSHEIHIYHQGKVLLSVVAVYALATVLFGISHNFLLSLFALLVIGAANNVSVNIRTIIRQHYTPDNMLGRLFAMYSFVWIAGDKLGDMEGGFLAGLLGAPASVVIGGLVALGVVGTMTIFNPQLRNHTLAQ